MARTVRVRCSPSPLFQPATDCCFAADDTCVQPHYFAHVAAFISQQTGIADVNFSAQSASTSDPHSSAAAPSSDPHPSPASAPVVAGAGADEPTPLSTAPGSPTTSASSSSAASEGGSSSFEFIEASTEGLPLPAKEEGEEESAIAGAGSLGPKEEVEEVLREAKDELRRQKL
jgi:hypothetical protein